MKKANTTHMSKIASAEQTARDIEDLLRSIGPGIVGKGTTACATTTAVWLHDNHVSEEYTLVDPERFHTVGKARIEASWKTLSNAGVAAKA